MANNKKRVYVVTLYEGDKRLYFEHEERGLIDPHTSTIIRQSKGFFSPDLRDAQKYLDKWRAELVASAYEGAGVECIKEGERLK